MSAAAGRQLRPVPDVSHDVVLGRCPRCSAVPSAHRPLRRVHERPAAAENPPHLFRRGDCRRNVTPRISPTFAFLETSPLCFNASLCVKASMCIFLVVVVKTTTS